MSLMQDGITWLAERLKESAGQTVVYRRGPQTVSVTAWLSMPRPEELSAADVVFERHDLIDVRMVAADLTLDSAAILPQRGDKIEITRGSATDVYEVMATGDEPPFWWPDTDHTLIGVHAKQIERG